MERRPYPTMDGRPVPVEELELAPSRLDPRKLGNTSLHHYWYDAPFYRADFIFNSLRNLKGEHVRMLNDQHNLGRVALHAIFGEPAQPTYKYAMERLEQAWVAGEPFEIQQRGKNNKRWVDVEFTEGDWLALQAYYNKVKDYNGILIFDMGMAAD